MEFVLGFLISCAVGLTGVGAGSITAPVLILFFHLNPAVAVGTALTFAAVIKLAVLPVYIRRQQVDYRVLRLLCLGGIPGVIAGTQVLNRLNMRDHEGTIFLVLGFTILTISLANLYRTLRYRMTAASVDHSGWLPPIAGLIGAEVGFSSAGAGALGALALMSLTRLTPRLVVGTDMLFGLTISVLGSGFHLFVGHYDSLMVIKLCAGGIVGALCGARLSSIVPSRPLRIALSICLVGLGLQLCWKALS